jgi:hypothetical protein
VLVDIHKGDRGNHKDDRNDQGDIILHKLLDKLKQQYNMPIESNQTINLDHEIFYYLTKGQIYVNCGNDPVNEDIGISPEDYM